MIHVSKGLWFYLELGSECGNIVSYSSWIYNTFPPFSFHSWMWHEFFTHHQHQMYHPTGFDCSTLKCCYVVTICPLLHSVSALCLPCFVHIFEHHHHFLPKASSEASPATSLSRTDRHRTPFRDIAELARWNLLARSRSQKKKAQMSGGGGKKGHGSLGLVNDHVWVPRLNKVRPGRET